MKKTIIVIAALVVLLAGVIFAYQSPVTFVDTVRSTDLNIGFQKLVQWINDNNNDIDTLHNRVDSIPEFIHDSLDGNWAAFIADDTVTAYRAAIHDTIITHWATFISDIHHPDTVFCGYNTTTKTILADQTMFLELDGTTRSDGIYTVVQSDTVLDISTAGDYLITYGATIDYDAGSGASYFRVQLMKYTSSWAAVTGSVMYQAIEANAAGHYMTVSKSIIVTLAAGNDLGVEFYVPVTLPTIDIIANSGFLTIEKIH